MPITHVKSKAAVEDVYEDVKDLVIQTARQFARRYNRDLEETLADACVYFLEALHTFDPSRGQLRPRLRTRIWHQLHDARKREIHVWEQFRGHQLTDSHAAHDPEPFDREGLEISVEEDGTYVISLLLDTPAELLSAIQTDPHPGPQTIARHVRNHLIQQGWEEKRIASAFRQIRLVLSC